MTDAPSDAALDPQRARLVHGGPAPVPERLAVRAGPLSLVIEAGDVRHVHVAGREVVRRIYGAVRDHTWHTVPARITGFTLDRGDDTFRCRYRADHRHNAVAFVWDATIEGSADGTLTFAFDGVAEATFDRNRIGLCLLHPLPGLSGAPIRLTTTDGTQRALHFPDLVDLDQPIAGFRDIAALACEIGPDLWLEAVVEGDVFETEDQRNWIDASTKTYSTPVGLPKPVTVAKGTRVTQRITLRLVTEDGAPARPTAAPSVVDRPEGELRAGEALAGRLPAIGILAGGAVARVQPAYVRVDLDLASDDAPAIFAAAAAAKRAVSGPPFELGLHVPFETDAASLALARIGLAGVDVVRILAFTSGHDVTQPATLDAVRAWRDRHAGRGSVPIATGTASDLARIHMAPTPPAPADALCWAMDPQAHATDLTTIAESPDGARDQVRSVRRRYPGRALAITASLGRHGGADGRIGSLFAAGWTLALVAALGEAGAESVTFVDRWPDAGDPAALPIAHVLRALTPLHHARIRPVASTLDTVRAVWLEGDDGDVLFVANLAPRRCELRLPAAPAGWTMWRLDAETLPAALAGGSALVDPGLGGPAGGSLTLGPCAIARLETPRG